MYLEKLAEMFERIGRFGPLVGDYEAIFVNSDRVRVAVSLIYAGMVRCCAKAMKILAKKRKFGGSKSIPQSLISLKSTYYSFPGSLKVFRERLLKGSA
jgi:hypothetical protein